MIQKATATLYQFIIGLFSDENLISPYNWAVARFFNPGGGGGVIMSAECTSLVGGGGGSGGILLHKNFQIWRLRGAIFYPRILVQPVTSPVVSITGTLCKLERTLQIVHIHANFNRGFCFL